jgi:transposase
LGIAVHQCRPRDPEAKGIVERANGYLESSFLPGRAFSSPADFNTQLTDWLAVANTRHVRRIGCAPTARWAADRAGMLALPPVAPTIGWRTQVRLPRDHYVRIDSNDYSVDPACVGRKVDVLADLAQVTATLDGQVVAVHDRCWARHQSLTDPVHHQAALELAHRARRRPDTTDRTDTGEVEQRDLAAYDAAFGLNALPA